MFKNSNNEELKLGQMVKIFYSARGPVLAEIVNIDGILHIDDGYGSVETLENAIAVTGGEINILEQA